MLLIYYNIAVRGLTDACLRESAYISVKSRTSCVITFTAVYYTLQRPNSRNRQRVHWQQS